MLCVVKLRDSTKGHKIIFEKKTNETINNELVLFFHYNGDLQFSIHQSFFKNKHTLNCVFKKKYKRIYSPLYT